jgi:uncharacterized protein YceH (UPF0502 family)
VPQPYDATIDHYRSVRPANGATNRETKHERFVRLATGRMQRALKAIALVGQCSSSDNEYGEHEARKIIAALNEQVADVARRLAHEKPQTKVFSFDE